MEYFKTKARAELQQDDQLLRLKSEELDEYSDLQRRLIGASWNLLRKYHLPDSYRLTQNGLDKFYAALQEGTPSKRKRMLKYIAGEFAMYPPYWYYCGMSALESGSPGDAGEYFRKFDDVWRPVLRRDPYKAEALKYRINVLVKPGINERNAGEIMNCLVDMRDNTELEDWANNIYMGMMYFALGHKDKAEECVMCNIDFGYESEVSGRVLAKFESETPPVKFAVPERVPELPKSEHPAHETEKLSVWGSFMKWLKPESMPVKVSPPQPVPQPVQEVTPKVDARYYRLLNVKTLRGKAEKGDTEAQYHLGLKCEKNATSSALNEALTWYRKAAEQGHTHAREAYIALSLKRGKYYLEQGSNDDAIRCYEGAAEMGSTHAKEKLSEIRKPEVKPEAPKQPESPPAPAPKPKKEKPKKEKAVVSILHMSLMKFVVCLAAVIGGNWLLWRGIAMVHAKTRELYYQAAQKGHPDAQYRLGRSYEREMKDRRFCNNFMLPAAAFCGVAFVVVGLFLLKFTSWLWCIVALILSVCAVLMILTMEFENNTTLAIHLDGDEPHYNAEEWYLRAAGNGHAEAQYTLGKIYDSEGKYQAAYNWFAMAAKQGHSGAEEKLRTFGSQYK